MAPTHEGKRGLRGSQNARLLGARRGGGKPPCVALGHGALVCRDHEARKPPEGRILRFLPQFDLALVESVAVTRDQRPDHGMLRLMRLQITPAEALLASCPPDNLMQQLESAFGSPRIAVRQAKVGVDHSHEIELGKMMSFGDELRPYDDIETAMADLIELLTQPLH